MAQQTIQRITAKGIISQAGRVLLVRDHRGKWELPGGRIEFGENPADALTRELREELGLANVAVEDIIHAWSFTSTAEDTQYHFIVLVYECRAEIDQIQRSDEHETYGWFSPRELSTLDIRSGYVDAVMQYQTMRD